MKRQRAELFLASFLMLFVELVLIRWAGAHIIYLSYFSNFVLLGSFLGIGIAFLRANRSPDLFRWSLVVLTFFVALVREFPVVIDRSGGDLIFFGALVTRGLPAWLMLPIVFLSVALILACFAHGVATRFHHFEPLEAYRLDIGGSIAGIGAYAAMSFLGVPPAGWGVLIAVLYLAINWRPTIAHAAWSVMLVVVLSLSTIVDDSIWSPYYRISFTEGRNIAANGVPHQAMAPVAGTPYLIPYERVTGSPQRVLVIGAGNGNDVAAALSKGAAHVDAVEIDPEVQQLGLAHHPDQPYQDSRVSVVIGDGRAFLENSTDRYDLIVFALPDSLTLVSGQSGVRLESFLFTREALESARDHLSEDGAFAMYNFYRETWLLDRLAGGLEETFGNRPCLDEFGVQADVVGRASMMVVAPSASVMRCETTWAPSGEIVAASTDDHPFVYLQERAIPSRYLVAMALIAVLSLVVVRTYGGKLSGMTPYADLFFMGVAFLLLETKNVVQFALLFGTTWLVNALVFGGILLSVLAAIEVEKRFHIARPGRLYALLFVGLAVTALVPPRVLLELPAVPRFLVATVFAFLPIFIANLVFAGRFRSTANPTLAFGANLLGAMFGGVIEYVSLVTGYRLLLMVAGLLYLAAWLSGRSLLSPAKG